MIFDKMINDAVNKRLEELAVMKEEIKLLRENQIKLRDDMDLGLDGIIKVFEMKLESLGYKKSIVTDLLKKIAKLEGNNVSS
jgi:hypothetical protein